jgi:hypothetical protein
MSKETAERLFVALVAKYGLQWTAAVPREAYDSMAAVNAVLSTTDKRRALGLPA